jgi:hypothetical protein
MASSSEVTLGARVTNAEKILTNLESFTDYTAADPSLSKAALKTSIKDIRTKNTETASAAQAYSASVDIRQNLFQKADNSLIKVLSLAGATVRSSFDKTSKEAADISAMITKIRGVKVKKAVKDPTADFVSQSERSYGSMTQNFSDMITTLENYGAKYTPANIDIKITTLKDKLIKLNAANIAVTATYGEQKKKRDDRAELYKNLTAITQRIKDGVKSQYGLKSTEYSLIKGLKV